MLKDVRLTNNQKVPSDRFNHFTMKDAYNNPKLLLLLNGYIRTNEFHNKWNVPGEIKNLIKEFLGDSTDMVAGKIHHIVDKWGKCFNDFFFQIENISDLLSLGFNYSKVNKKFIFKMYSKSSEFDILTFLKKGVYNTKEIQAFDNNNVSPYGIEANSTEQSYNSMSAVFPCFNQKIFSFLDGNQYKKVKVYDELNGYTREIFKALNFSYSFISLMCDRPLPTEDNFWEETSYKESLVNLISTNMEAYYNCQCVDILLFHNGWNASLILKELDKNNSGNKDSEAGIIKYKYLISQIKSQRLGYEKQKNNTNSIQWPGEKLLSSVWVSLSRLQKIMHACEQGWPALTVFQMASINDSGF
ncbi:MAG: hypothetical protein GY730_06135, partial [bacterium]|nr:hypothetical protein [bacterium]